MLWVEMKDWLWDSGSKFFNSRTDLIEKACSCDPVQMRRLWRQTLLRESRCQISCREGFPWRLSPSTASLPLTRFKAPC